MTIIKNFEQIHNCTVIYLATSGSKLYGTDSPTSDTDYKGIFITNKNDLILKKDLEHWTYETGNDKSKNTKEDVDLQLWSLHKFMHLLIKGDTGALDLLFSMQDKQFAQITTDLSERIWKDRQFWLHKNTKAFVGYALGQARKYGIKGARYKELTTFNKYLQHTARLQGSFKLKTLLGILSNHIDNHKYKYIKITRAPGPLGTNGHEIIDYVEILDKKFSKDVTLDYMLERSIFLESTVGHRTKAAAEGTDWKALSHAIRVLTEVIELLGLHTIRFPLENAQWLKGIKSGEYELEPILEAIEERIDYIDQLLIITTLPETANQKQVNKLILETYS